MENDREDIEYGEIPSGEWRSQASLDREDIEYGEIPSGEWRMIEKI